MINIIIILVFSIVMLMFVAFPAMKITDFIKNKTDFSKNTYNTIQIVITIVLSLFVGLFLKLG